MGSGSLPKDPRPRVRPREPQTTLTDEVRHEQEDIFAWHRGGPLGATDLIWRCQLYPRSAARPHPPARRSGRANRAQDPAAPGQPQMFKLAARRSMGRRCAGPFQWADPRLRPPRRRSGPQLRPPPLYCAPCKIGKRKRLKNGCAPFKICPLPFPLPPSVPFLRLVPNC